MAVTESGGIGCGRGAPTLQFARAVGSAGAGDERNGLAGPCRAERVEAPLAAQQPARKRDEFARAHCRRPYRLPTVYREFAQVGALLSYENDLRDNYRRAAACADRILRGEQPSELPVEVPVKFELVINPAWLPVLDLDPVNETTRAIR